MKDDDVKVMVGVGLGVLLLGSSSSGSSTAREPSAPTEPAQPDERVIAPSTTSLASATVAGWLWPLPTVALDAMGVRTAPGQAGAVATPAAISQGLRLPDHEGVDICYRRPGGNLPSLRKPAPVFASGPLTKAVRPALFRSIEEWLASLKPGERQRWAAGYLPGQRIGGSSTPGGATLGDWQDSRAGTRGHFCPERVLCRSVAAGQLWATGDSPRGHWVLISHGSYTTWYGHMSSLAVPPARNGKLVGTTTAMQLVRGHVLGVVGYDPSAPRTVRHLHLQMVHYPAGVRTVVDPALSLARAERWVA